MKSEEKKHTAEIFAMDTVIGITSYGDMAQKSIEEATKVIRSFITEHSAIV